MVAREKCWKWTWSAMQWDAMLMDLVCSFGIRLGALSDQGAITPLHKHARRRWASRLIKILRRRDRPRWRYTPMRAPREIERAQRAGAGWCCRWHASPQNQKGRRATRARNQSNVSSRLASTAVQERRKRHGVKELATTTRPGFLSATSAGNQELR